MHGMVPCHYSKSVSAPKDGAFACGAHSDYGFMTFLTTDSVPGLEVLRSKSGGGVVKGQHLDGGSKNSDDHMWVPVPPLPNNFIVNLGDMLMQWTNDKYLSTVHRVVNHKGLERYSIPFFFEPNFNTVVECLPQFATMDNPAKYAATTSGDYKLFKHLEAHDELREKVEKESNTK